VGNLQFTDDQLQQTQRGLDAAGIAMPKFGALGKTLAKEMNVEPEPEPESEEERESASVLDSDPAFADARFLRHRPRAGRESLFRARRTDRSARTARAQGLRAHAGRRS
jgi:hypothetical protein